MEPSGRPTSVNVLGIEIEIEYTHTLDEDLHGQYDPDALKIEIRDGLNAENTRLILWHEITHVVESLGALRITETGICLFSTAFIQIMKANPSLAWWSFGVPLRKDVRSDTLPE